MTLNNTLLSTPDKIRHKYEQMTKDSVIHLSYITKVKRLLYSITTTGCTLLLMVWRFIIPASVGGSYISYAMTDSENTAMKANHITQNIDELIVLIIGLLITFLTGYIVHLLIKIKHKYWAVCFLVSIILPNIFLVLLMVSVSHDKNFIFAMFGVFEGVFLILCLSLFYEISEWKKEADSHIKLLTQKYQQEIRIYFETGQNYIDQIGK